MNLFLHLAYLFFLGSTFGWILEVFYRRFISAANPERKWINPGFCTGPYLPLYGTGLCILYLCCAVGEQLGVALWWHKLILILVMGIAMTVIEYIAGYFSLKYSHVRLWDYRNEWGNIQGIICPKFSFFWTVLCALYYLLLHPLILRALAWLADNLAFCFVIGLFFGVFLVDVVYSTQLVAKIKKFAKENNVVVAFDRLKSAIRSAQEKGKERTHFFFAFSSRRPLTEYLKEMPEKMESVFRKDKKSKEKSEK